MFNGMYNLAKRHSFDIKEMVWWWIMQLSQL
jgi:hypothetical protein